MISFGMESSSSSFSLFEVDRKENLSDLIIIMVQMIGGIFPPLLGSVVFFIDLLHKKGTISTGRFVF